MSINRCEIWIQRSNNSQISITVDVDNIQVAAYLEICNLINNIH